MIKRICDVCGNEVNTRVGYEWQDSENEFYQLTKRHYGNTIDYEVDICKECLHKLTKLIRYERKKKDDY